jgi:plastocyanin
MQGSHVHFRAYLALLIILMLLVGFFYELYSLGVIGGVSQTAVQQTVSPFPPSAPAATEADLVTAQQSFNYLVSYTVSGFHPTTLTMKAGQTVRFTDNSPDPITIAGAGTSSPVLEQSMYWQYAATKTGTLTFTGNNQSGITVTVTK